MPLPASNQANPSPSPAPSPAPNPAPNPAPTDTHEWISFDDRTEKRTWMIDATFLRSTWSCIFGSGCKGVLDADATEMVQGCCSYGAHFVDDDDVQTVVRAVVRLTPKDWQFAKKAKTKGFLDTGDDGATVTRLVDDACIFLNRPGFEGGPGCALHRAALEAGERPMDWKPNVCWQLPLRLDHHTDDQGHVTSTLREWKRRDWGPGGDEFHWWCTETDEAFVAGSDQSGSDQSGSDQSGSDQSGSDRAGGKMPVYEYLRDEIVGMVGREVYDQLLPLLTRPKWTPLPHPAVRRR